MTENWSIWLFMLPPALTAWSAAAALLYVLLEIKAVPAAKCWATGFVLIGLGAFAGPSSPDGTTLQGLMALGSYGMGVLIIGIGLLCHLGHKIPRTRVIGAGVLVFGGLILVGAMTPGPDVACTIETWLTTALCVSLAVFCLVGTSARRRGGGMKFVAFALALMAARPLLPMWYGGTDMGAALVLSTLTIAPILLCLGLAVMALRDQERRAHDSDRRRRWTDDRYTLALRGSNDGVWDWDPERDSVFANERLREICGLEDGSPVMSADFAALVHPADLAAYREAVQDVMDGVQEKLNAEVRLRVSARATRGVDGGADGTRWVLVRGIPVRGSDGRVTRMAGTVTDVTERKTAERQLIDAKEEAELASRSKTEFLAHMSHELRTPLNSIIGFSDMMKSEVFGPIKNEKYEDYVGTINMAGRHLLGLISDIIDVSKVESGQTQLHDTLCDLNEIAESATRLMAERIDQAGLGFTVDIAPHLPWLRGDEIRVKQILLNLLTNAAKFTPAGGHVTLTIDTDTKGRPRVEVADTGIGISRKDIPKALSRFGRLASPFTRTTDGMGLGLTLVQLFVGLHGGEFELQSDEGRGTRVVVLFPKDRAVARPRSNPDSDPASVQDARNEAPSEPRSEAGLERRAAAAAG
jgi:PAS domain S-box-containing protein